MKKRRRIEELSTQYIGQEIQASISRLIEKKVGGNVTIEHRYYKGDDENPENSTLTYSLVGIKVRITISKNKGRKGYRYLEELGLEGQGNGELKTVWSGNMKIQRSKQGRISQSYSDSIAERSFKELRDYAKRRIR